MVIYILIYVVLGYACAEFAEKALRKHDHDINGVTYLFILFAWPLAIILVIWYSIEYVMDQNNDDDNNTPDRL